MAITLNGTTGISTPDITANSATINAGYYIKGITYLTSGTAATYTTPTGVRALKVTVIGAGGGAGGVDGQATASTNAYSAGGGGGGFAIAFITSAESSYTYTIGAGGAGGGANTIGAAGGTTSFENSGSTIIISASGGAGGAGDIGATSTGSVSGAPGIGSITGLGNPGGFIGSGTGQYANGYGRIVSGTVYSHSGSGWCPLVGGGVATASASNGTDATNYGEGGGPVRTSTAVATNYVGGSGYQGLIIIEEYY